MSLLTPPVANTPLHIIMGSRLSDHGFVERMVDYLKLQGFTDYVIHVLSCHRNADEVRQFALEFAGQAIWAAGGKSFQLPAVLQSWLFFYGKHVPIWGHPVAQTAEDTQAAVSAMRDVPMPMLIHWRGDSDAQIDMSGSEILSLINKGKFPDGDTPEDWAGRLVEIEKRKPEIDIKL